MYYIDHQGKIQKVPKICLINTKQKNEILMRTKYNIHQ